MYNVYIFLRLTINQSVKWSHLIPQSPPYGEGHMLKTLIIYNLEIFLDRDWFHDLQDTKKRHGGNQHFQHHFYLIKLLLRNNTASLIMHRLLFGRH